MTVLEVTLRFSGRETNNHVIDLYDVSQALIGFERSLALTTHLILNNEIITQAPSLKGAKILARPPREGSWELTATILVLTAGAVYKLGTAPKDTPIGHLIRSAYDYLISQTLGISVDYDKTLGKQLKESKQQDQSIPDLTQARFDSLVEKCDTAVREMHRPISKSSTADSAKLISRIGDTEMPVGPTLTLETYEYISYTERSTETVEHIGRISSYNVNTYKGRIYVPSLGRPIPFELAENAKDSTSIGFITQSLDANAQRRDDGDVQFVTLENFSRSGRLKGFFILSVDPMPVEEL